MEFDPIVANGEPFDEWSSSSSEEEGGGEGEEEREDEEEEEEFLRIPIWMFREKEKEKKPKRRRKSKKDTLFTEVVKLTVYEVYFNEAPSDPQPDDSVELATEKAYIRELRAKSERFIEELSVQLKPLLDTTYAHCSPTLKRLFHEVKRSEEVALLPARKPPGASKGGRVRDIVTGHLYTAANPMPSRGMLLLVLDRAKCVVGTDSAILHFAQLHMVTHVRRYIRNVVLSTFDTSLRDKSFAEIWEALGGASNRGFPANSKIPFVKKLGGVRRVINKTMALAETLKKKTK